MKQITRGAAGEWHAARLLRDKGYCILSSNFRCRFGEIDIVAADDEYLVFVEVKTRSPEAIYRPREAVDRRKQQKLLRAAQIYYRQTKMDLQPRFDVIEVTLHKEELLRCEQIDHIIGAFDFDDLLGSI